MLVTDKAVAWSIVLFSLVQQVVSLPSAAAEPADLTSTRSVGAHVLNAWWIAVEASAQLRSRVATFFEVNFTTGPGITGWIMSIALALMAWFAVEKRKKLHFERFWYSHHLFIVFFVAWQLHGVSRSVNPPRDFADIGSPWQMFCFIQSVVL